MKRMFVILGASLMALAVCQDATLAVADTAVVPAVGQVLRLPQFSGENLYLRVWHQDEAKLGEACMLRPQGRVTVVAYLPQLDVVIVSYATDAGPPKHLARYCVSGDLLKMNRWQYDRIRQRILEQERPRRESDAIREAVQNGLEQLKK